MKSIVSVVALVATLCLASSALAHLTMIAPQHRYAEVEQKTDPCGRAGGVRGTNVAVYEPGATITVQWRETINHPSHYRISFDEDGDDDFCYPANKDDYYTCESVLLDNIPDDPSQQFSVEVTLPDVECENCTLQVVQVMYDKVGGGRPWGDDDLYFNCADLALRTADPNAPDAGPDAPDATPGTEPDAGEGNSGGDVDGGGCAVGKRSSSNGVGTLLLLAVFVVRVRRSTPRR